MKKFLRKLLPTIVMLAVSATLVGTSTFAWFSMNNKVTVTGMMVKTKVSSNLWIAADKLENQSQLKEDQFLNSIKQVVTGILQPASSIDALNFYYTTSARTDGSKTGSDGFLKYGDDGEPTSSSAYADKFSEVYGVSKEIASGAGLGALNKAVPYVDYCFQLKASNTGTADQYIVVEALNIRYKGSVPESKAHRVAFFITEFNGTGSSAVYSEGSSATYTIASSANFIDNTSSSSTLGTVVTGSSSYAAPTYVTTPKPLKTVTSGTKYYKVVVRLWLEGQDTTCNNDTFMELTESWELGLKLALVDSNTAGVAYINKVTSSASLTD